MKLFDEDEPPIGPTYWLMPDLTGIELSEHIRQKIHESHTDIIILTGLRERGKLVIGLEAGADDCLTKPFLSSELLAAGA